MNTLIINNEDFIVEQTNCKIDIKVDDLKLEIKGNVHIYDFNTNDKLNLDITLVENSTLYYYMFSNNNFSDKVITINNNDNSKVNFNYSFINSKDSKVIINNNILGNNINSSIKVRGVCTDNAKSIIESNGYVIKNTINNEFDEDIRGLNLDNGMVIIKPNLFIDTNEVIANHNATIGNINKDYLFYLNSKGINTIDAKKLITTGFIKSILNGEIKEDIDKIFN